MARQIAGQVIELRAIEASAGSGSMAGAYGRKLHAAAGDVAGQLQQAAARYERASAALEGWVPELADAQAVSLRALTMAEAPYLTLKNVVPPQPAPGTTLTAAQEQDEQSFQRLSQRDVRATGAGSARPAGATAGMASISLIAHSRAARSHRSNA